MSRPATRIVSIFVCFLAASSALAQAAEPAPAGDSGLVEEVVVTARRREEAQETVPASVTVFNQRQLSRGEIRDLTDLKGLSPNTMIDWLGVSPTAAAITIRGIGVTQSDKSFDPAVGVMLDGVYIGTSTTALQHNFDLEAVEVLRGPQGALFGRNTSGGVISLRRSLPTGELGLRASVTGTSWGRHDYKLIGNFPIVKNVLAGKVGFYSLNTRGLFENSVTGEYLPDSHYLSGLLDLLYTPTSKLSIRLQYERARDREQSVAVQGASDQSDLICYGPTMFPGGFTFDEPQCRDPEQGKLEIRSNFRNDMGLDLDAITLNVTQELGDDYRLVSVSGWRGHDEDVWQDFDGTPEDFFSTRNTQRFDQISEELRLEGDIGERVGLVTGVFYYYGHYDQDGTTFFLYEQPILGTLTGRTYPRGTVGVQDVGQDTHSVAAFSNVDVDIVDRLRASVGGRYTWEQKTLHNDWGYSNYLDSPTARDLEAMYATPTVRGTRHWDRFTPRASIDYTLDERALGKGQESLLYASYAQGFRSGGFSTRANPATTKPFDPERVDQYEAGLKTSWLERRLMLNVAVFHTRFLNKQEEILLESPSGGTQTVTQNAARARIRGLEVEASSLPLYGHSDRVGEVRLWGSLGLLDAEYQKFVTNFRALNDDSVARNYAGLSLAYAPRYQVAAGVDVPVRLADLLLLSANLQYRRRSAYRASFTVDSMDKPDRRGITPAYDTLDASLSFEAHDFLGGSWRITAFGRNMLGNRSKLFYVDVSDLFAVQAYNPPAQWGGEIALTY